MGVRIHVRLWLFSDRWQRRYRGPIAICALRRAIEMRKLDVRRAMAVAASDRPMIRVDLALLAVRRRPVRIVAPHLDVVRRELADLQGRVRAP